MLQSFFVLPKFLPIVPNVTCVALLPLLVVLLSDSQLEQVKMMSGVCTQVVAVRAFQGQATEVVTKQHCMHLIKALESGTKLLA